MPYDSADPVGSEATMDEALGRDGNKRRLGRMMSRATQVALLLRQLLLDIVIHGVSQIAMGSENSIALI